MATLSATNKHHVFWPRRAYKSPIERHFRQLPCNIMQVAVTDHDDFHLMILEWLAALSEELGYPVELPKPSAKIMAAAIERHDQCRCTCYRKE